MATRNPNSLLSYTFIDGSNEKSVMTFSAVEYNAGTFPAYLTAIGDFRDSLALVSGGALRSERMTLFDTVYNAVTPAIGVKRELKWLILLRDDVTFADYRIEIPCASDTSPATATPPNEPLLLPQSDEADLSATAWTTFIDDLRQVYRTPDGNFATVRKIIQVGRNL